MRAAANSTPTTPGRSRWVWIAVGIVVLAVVGVIAYMALYNGNGGYGGEGGTGGGGYFILAFSGDQARRLRNRVLSRR
jgi:flagellar basal body-associated protein FliL